MQVFVTWRIFPAVPLVAALLTLAACGGGNKEGGGFLAGLSGSSGAKAPRTTRLAGRQITVEGPQGFCIDKGTRLETDTGGFVLLAACAAISGNEDDSAPPVPAVLTVSVSELADAGVATPEELESFFRTEAGLATLSHSGQADNASLVSLTAADGALLIHARDGSSGRPAALADDYWRGMFTINNHLVSLSVMALSDYPIADQTGRALLRSFVNTIQNANPEAENTGTGLKSLLNSLLSGN